MPCGCKKSRSSVPISLVCCLSRVDLRPRNCTTLSSASEVPPNNTPYHNTTTQPLSHKQTKEHRHNCPHSPVNSSRQLPRAPCFRRVSLPVPSTLPNIETYQLPNLHDSTPRLWFTLTLHVLPPPHRHTPRLSSYRLRVLTSHNGLTAAALAAAQAPVLELQRKLAQALTVYLAESEKLCRVRESQPVETGE